MRNYLINYLDKARLQQKSTISRPDAAFSSFSKNLPISYYDKTTPYVDYDTDVDDEDENDGYTFDENNNILDTVEAINQFVKVHNLEISI